MSQKNLQKGRVLKSTGSWYQVESELGEIIEARLQGKIRLQGIKSTNPVAVGDVVYLIKEKEAFNITEIETRKNVLVRRSINLSKRTHILAANLDRLFVVFTLKDPDTTTSFLDRILVSAEAYGIEPQVIFHKMDLLESEADNEEIAMLKFTYEKIGYRCFESSLKNPESLSPIKNEMRSGISLFTGHSGVGKSSLINAINPGLDLKTAEISKSYKQGKHTTTFAEMHKLDFGGYIIDSPGIKGFGMVDFPKNELALYFPEMKALLSECKFYNCTHTEEPDCAVKKALEAFRIAPSRYQSYLGMFFNEDENPYRTVNY